MILMDKMKDLKIYKTQTFLPTLIDDKKKQSLIYLLSPSYEASKRMMSYPLFVNKLRYQSYYLERNISYYIGGKFVEDDEDDPKSIKESYDYYYLTEMTAEERNSLPDSAFGIPSKRKYPLDTEAHVRSAIKFFNYCEKEDEETLARNIIKALKKFNITDIKVSKKNRFYDYYVKSGIYKESIIVEDYVDEDALTTSYLLNSISNEDVFIADNKLIFFNEDSKYDSRLKQMLFKSRLKRMKDVTPLYEKMQKDCPFIKYLFYQPARYQGRNLFVDLYFYNNAFFTANTWTNLRGFNLYYDFMQRLLSDKPFKDNGYKFKSIFIPVNEWDRGKDASVWNFKKDINPISIIYQLLYTNQLKKLQDLFGNNNVVFIGRDTYFKIKFSDIDPKQVKVFANRFKMFLIKICKNEEFDQDDIDSSADNHESSDVIATKIVDAIDVNKGIDLTPQMATVKKKIEIEKKKAEESKKVSTGVKQSFINTTSQQSKEKKEVEKQEEKEIKVNTSNIDKLTLNDPKTEIKLKAAENKKLKLANKIVKAAMDSDDEDGAYDNLDNDDDDDESVEDLLDDLSSDEDDSVNISASRAERLADLNKKSEEKKIKNKSVKDIINEPAPKNKVTKLDIASPNKQIWENMSFMNFDKEYNIDKDIILAFKHFADVSRPLAIKDISVEDTSTSEDRIETYKVEYEDYRGKRFTIKLDIPIMVDNRFLLRGNNKSIQTQLQNMPIIKTDINTCQIISNYMKIFIYRFGDGNSKALPISNKIMKALSKYKGTNIKISYGNNRKLSTKYSLPIDYIGLAEIFTKIETADFIIYFNQDEIRKLYTIEEGKGIPYLYDKKTKSIVYFSITDIFSYIFMDLFYSYGNKYEDFTKLVESAANPTICSYSKCSIMSTMIPLIVICSYHEGLRKVLEKAKVNYRLSDKLTQEDRHNQKIDYVRFSDGYLIFESTYESSLLLNGLKACSTADYSISQIDNKNMYLEFLDDFGGKLKADGLENFYDLMMDHITVDVLKFYKMPTDYVSVLLYANALLADNKFTKHTDISTRRMRRYELIAVYVYKALADAYARYANGLKHSREATKFMVKQSAVIDLFLLDPISSDDSCINALRDVETTNAVTTKGPSGMNSDRAYSVDKRTFDSSMTNVIGMSTGFAANVGVTRQATINANVDSNRGYVKTNNGKTNNMNSSKTLTATEALTPFCANRDDPFRTAMTFIQTSKHLVRTEQSDPLLVTCGADEAMAYLTTDKFAHKAKGPGIVREVTDQYAIIEYENGSHEYINLEETIEKNSDGGYFVPLKLSLNEGIEVGTKVTENQIIAYDKYSFSNSIGESDNLAYNNGKLAKIAVINSDDCFEDSGIATQALTEKLATRIDLEYSHVIEKDATIYSMKQIGDHVEVGDHLLTWQDSYGDEDTAELIKSMSNKNDFSDLGKQHIDTEVTGTISDIKIFRTADLEDLSESLREIVSKYEAKYNKLERKLKQYNINSASLLPAHKQLPPLGKLKRANDAVYIVFYVEYKDTVGVGDKVVSNAANKQVEKSIIPLGKEPYTEFRPNEKIDALVSEVSIDKRLVTSTIIVGSLNKLMIELDRSVKDILGIPYDSSTI